MPNNENIIFIDNSRNTITNPKIKYIFIKCQDKDNQILKETKFLISHFEPLYIPKKTQSIIMYILDKYNKKIIHQNINEINNQDIIKIDKIDTSILLNTD
jgi:hypothetical protein